MKSGRIWQQSPPEAEAESQFQEVPAFHRVDSAAAPLANFLPNCLRCDALRVKNWQNLDCHVRAWTAQHLLHLEGSGYIVKELKARSLNAGQVAMTEQRSSASAHLSSGMKAKAFLPSALSSKQSRETRGRRFKAQTVCRGVALLKSRITAWHKAIAAMERIKDPS